MTMKRIQWKSPLCEARSPNVCDPSPAAGGRRRLWNSPSSGRSLPGWARNAGADICLPGPSRGSRRQWEAHQGARSLPAWAVKAGAEECLPGSRIEHTRPLRQRWDAPYVDRRAPEWAGVAGDLNEESEDEYFDALDVTQGTHSLEECEDVWYDAQVDSAPEGYTPHTLLPSPNQESPPQRRRWDSPRNRPTEVPSWASRDTRVTTRLQTGGRRCWVGHTASPGRTPPAWASTNFHRDFVEMPPPRNRQRWAVAAQSPPRLHTWALPRADITELPPDYEC